VRFTFASHPLQDSTSPSHSPWAPWSGKELLRELVHHVNQEARTPGPGSQLYKATRDLFDMFFNSKPMPKNIIENYKTDPAQKMNTQDNSEARA
jgi:hypothetical protein